MADRVDERASELAKEAARFRSEKNASEARCRAVLSDLAETLLTTLTGHTKYKPKTHIDLKESSLRVSFMKRQFEKTVEREILEVRVNRLELDRGTTRIFQLRVPFDAGLPTWMTPPATDINAGDALKTMVEVVLETMAKSVANGCAIIDPG